MKKILFAFIFSSILIFNGYSQLEKTTTQAGISVLPIFDVLKLFPKNNISGIAVSGNLGYLTIEKLSIGINPYYAQVSNTYTNPPSIGGDRQKQNIKLYGLNTYLRYYLISKEKFLLYSSISVGFGNIEQKTISLPSLTVIKNSYTDKSVFTFLLGIGANYFLTKNLALELNVPFINLKYISTNPKDTHFQTVAPTIGLQFYWK